MDIHSSFIHRARWYFWTPSSTFDITDAELRSSLFWLAGCVLLCLKAHYPRQLYDPIPCSALLFESVKYSQSYFFENWLLLNSVCQHSAKKSCTLNLSARHSSRDSLSCQKTIALYKRQRLLQL